jgi:hypothetical protein
MESICANWSATEGVPGAGAVGAGAAVPVEGAAMAGVGVRGTEVATWPQETMKNKTATTNRIDLKAFCMTTFLPPFQRQSRTQYLMALN